MKKFLFLIGSNNTNSVTKHVIDAVSQNLSKAWTDQFEYSIFMLKDYKIDYCTGCLTCFHKGYCVLDRKDDMRFIRKIFLEAEYVFLASPVYAHEMTGKMKSFIDRTAFWFHLLELSGKYSFTLSVTGSNGTELVSKTLAQHTCNYGMKNLCNFEFIEQTDDIESKAKFFSEEIIKSIKYNYGNSTHQLESFFNYYKDYYVMPDRKYHNEYLFWNQRWVKECDSFQEFVGKRKERTNGKSNKD